MQEDPRLSVVILYTHPLFGEGIARLLAAEALPAAVYNFHTVKPLDAQAVCGLAADYKMIVSVEEHSIYGGLGTALAEMLAERHAGGSHARLVRLGVRDTFGESGTADELLKKHGLDDQGIALSVRRAWTSP